MQLQPWSTCWVWGAGSGLTSLLIPLEYDSRCAERGVHEVRQVYVVHGEKPDKDHKHQN